MKKIRKSNDRGHADHGWLKSKHSFSFADYYDPAHMNHGILRVINEDWIDGGTGFNTHPHLNMEIISYVIEGALYHKDSMGNSTTILPCEVQRMSAGTGIRHSEHNHEINKQTHLLQIWIMPEKNNIVPSYAQKSFEKELESNQMALVISKEGRNGSITVNQDVDMYLVKSKIAGKKIHATTKKRDLWIQVIQGDVQVDDLFLSSGDGAGISEADSIHISWVAGSELILFDMVKNNF